VGCGDVNDKLLYQAYGEQWEADLEINLEETGVENQGIATFKAEYNGNNSEQLEYEPIIVVIIGSKGQVSQDFDGLPSNGILKYDFSKQLLISDLKRDDPVEMTITWNEDGQEMKELIYFEEFGKEYD